MRISPRPTTLSVADFRFAIDSQRLILGKNKKSPRNETLCVAYLLYVINVKGKEKI